MNRKSEMAARAGFTLMEIMIAVMIIGVLGTVAVANVTKYMDRARRTAAQEMVETLKNNVAIYQTDHRKKPTSLKQLVEGDDALIEGGEASLMDPWGNEYQYKAGKKPLIWSYGPDGTDGTADDIRSDKATSGSAE